jgi:hypothetical protein
MFDSFTLADYGCFVNRIGTWYLQQGRGKMLKIQDPTPPIAIQRGEKEWVKIY